MTHEQADEIILLLRAVHGGIADIADAIRAHVPKPPPKHRTALRRKGRPDPPLSGETPSEPTRVEPAKEKP